uniref:Uncharacterized protein n=1 Tax=Setaria viridis TaxID=4556 RepID=A0A4U6VS99_SETVI|nr:hypothetical protein SEVIR_2G055800v2 [Setaria viridis]
MRTRNKKPGAGLGWPKPAKHDSTRAQPNQRRQPQSPFLLLHFPPDPPRAAVAPPLPRPRRGRPSRSTSSFIASIHRVFYCACAHVDLVGLILYVSEVPLSTCSSAHRWRARGLLLLRPDRRPASDPS